MFGRLIMKFFSQAVDVRHKKCFYFDPLSSKERKMEGSDRLCSLIEKTRYKFSVDMSRFRN